MIGHAKAKIERLSSFEQSSLLLLNMAEKTQYHGNGSFKHCKDTFIAILSHLVLTPLCSSVSVLRSKRRCVLEKKQPYSGDEWCSGPDTEEDDDKPQTAMHRESDYFDFTMPVAVILTSRVMKARSDIHIFHLVLL